MFTITAFSGLSQTYYLLLLLLLLLLFVCVNECLVLSFLFCHAADVICSAAGDDQEGMRLIFDMTFFFFVIAILLAIVEGERVTCV